MMVRKFVSQWSLTFTDTVLDELDSISPATRRIQKGNDDADMEDLVADLGFL